MCTKAIIIFWRKTEETLINVQNLSDCKIYLYYDNRYNVKNCINKVNEINSEQKVILLHTNDPNYFLHEDKLNIKNGTNGTKVYLFGGGPEKNHPVYYHPSKYPKGILGNNDIANEALNSEKEIKEENFEFVCDWYWNKLDLVYQKKKIINLWLPLAIDIQGLSKVEEKKRKSYYEAVRKEINDNGNETNYYKKLTGFPKDDQFPEWTGIKEELKNDFQNFNPAELVKALKDEEYSSFKYNHAKYLDKIYNSGPNPNFLPNWLEEVTKILDAKINQD
jgi:hypothetical protein